MLVECYSGFGKTGNKTTYLLTCSEHVEEVTLYCVSYKLSKPQSQLKFFPTCHKIVKKTHVLSGSYILLFSCLSKNIDYQIQVINIEL